MSETLVVTGIDDQDAHPIDIDRWVELAEMVLTAEGVTGPAELNLTFVDVEEISRLNAEHMGAEGPTDVLSFPLDDRDAAVPVDQPRLLGDVVVCPAVVYAHAPSSPHDELALIVVHGVLHILGMDHADPDDKAAMWAAQDRHLERWRASP